MDSMCEPKESRRVPTPGRVLREETYVDPFTGKEETYRTEDRSLEQASDTPVYVQGKELSR